jgi:Cu(I)/Ag(I) efflux system membrane protein CusA/SilA
MIPKLARFVVEQPLYSLLLTIAVAVGGVLVNPYLNIGEHFGISRLDMDALPDIGEHQQIVTCEWPGYSPADVEEQIVFPLTTALMGIPQVKHIRANSMFGLASIYIIFEESADFYWCRARVIEKLSTLSEAALPEGVQPKLGPDATALGQVFWYTLEGRDSLGNPAGGWALDELRTVQDEYVKPNLQSVPGVAEVASIGGLVKEYEVQIDPSALRRLGIPISQVAEAIARNNRDVGAQTMEINRAEYMVRGLGQINSIQDIENILLKKGSSLTPIRVSDIGAVRMGTREQKGILDKEGAELAGGVVSVQLHANPNTVIEDIKSQIETLAPGMPTRILQNGKKSTLTIVPFYDRSSLIQESNAMLGKTLVLEMLIALLVLCFFLRRADMALLAILILPLGTALVFIAMRLLDQRANIVAMAGIAIAIGTMIDMAIIFFESLQQQEKENKNASNAVLIHRAFLSVGPALITAGLTTIVTFLPVFALQGEEGKLFTPLALTKTLALAAALILTILVLPGLARLLLRKKQYALPKWASIAILSSIFLVLLASWQPLQSWWSSALFLLSSVGLCFWVCQKIIQHYTTLLAAIFKYYRGFLSAILLLIIASLFIWRNLPRSFIPAFDEGTFLVMPTAASNAGTTECKELLQLLDMGIASIPEVKNVVGKAGRAESALDPAPMNMFEVMVNWHPEFERDSSGQKVRLWRSHIKSPDDIWNEIVAVIAQIPGLSIPPKLYPIETRLVMLQTGMSAPMGIKIKARSLEQLDSFAYQLEQVLQQVEGILPATVFSTQITGKPYLEIIPDRQRTAAYNISTDEVLQYIELAIGGKPVSQILNRNERSAISLRWPDASFQTPATIAQIELITRSGKVVPLGAVADINYRPGPQLIKSEDGFLVHHVMFDKVQDSSSIEVVENARAYLQQLHTNGKLKVPEGVSYTFEGDYEKHRRAVRRVLLAASIALLLLLAILYYRFRSISLSAIVFTGVLVACSGGFIALWLWNQNWFLDLPLMGGALQEALSIGHLPLSIPVWVGFLALIGIATDDGVLMATYLERQFHESKPSGHKELFEIVKRAGGKRIRAAMLTTATTILALLPVLSAHDKGSEMLVPMAVPLIGGMSLQIITIFIVPLLWSIWKTKKEKF